MMCLFGCASSTWASPQPWRLCSVSKAKEWRLWRWGGPAAAPRVLRCCTDWRGSPLYCYQTSIQLNRLSLLPQPHTDCFLLKPEIRRESGLLVVRESDVERHPGGDRRAAAARVTAVPRVHNSCCWPPSLLTNSLRYSLEGDVRKDKNFLVNKLHILLLLFRTMLVSVKLEF